MDNPSARGSPSGQDILPQRDTQSLRSEEPVTSHPWEVQVFKQL